jgi:hypothetical protein
MRLLFRIFVCCFVIVFCISANAFAQGDSVSIQIIPQPKKVEATQEKFPLDSNVRIVLADSRSEDDRFAAQDFGDDVKATTNVALSIGKSKRSILIGTLDNEKIKTAISKTQITTPPDLNDEGYALSVTANEVVIGGKTTAGTFYGLQTLKQLVRGENNNAYIQGARIVDFPTMCWRAFSDDISRGPVPTIDYIKRQIKMFAMFKMNMHSFYMEHTFGSRKHPLIAPEGGSLTPEEIKEIVAFAKKYHVEIVPEQQTFGHLHKALKFERYNALSETPYGDVLSPQQEGSYKLVADWYSEIAELFPGKFFHIGADETFELGEGQSKEEVKVKGVGAVYFAHINRVRDLLRPYNRRLMMWGDIALNHPELINQIPKEMIVMNWAYGPRDTYAPRIKPFKDAGLEQFVCPSVWNFNLIFPNNENAIANIRNFVRDGQEAGAIGVMNTNWDDDGETLFEMDWYGVLLGAAAGWENAPIDVEAFDKKFDWAFFRSENTEFTKTIRTLGSVNAMLGIGFETTNSIFWQTPFTNAFLKRARDSREKIRDMRLRVEEAEEQLIRDRAKAKRNAQMILSMRFAAQRFNHLGRRYQAAEKFSREYWSAYSNMTDKRQVNRLRRYTGAIYNELREMAEELSTLKEAYRKQWLAENRAYWLESVIARYDQAIQTWLNKSKQLEDALRLYETNSILPDPEEFGLGTKPTN